MTPVLTVEETQKSVVETDNPLIQRGIQLLDEYSPGWERSIDLDSLDMYSGIDCVAAQALNTHYGQAKRDLGITSGVGYGFIEPTYEWREVIRNRRDA